MKLSIARDVLLKALQQISGVVERRQTLPILSNILFKVQQQRLTIIATDLEVELINHCSIESYDDFSFTLPAKKLFDICRALPEQSSVDIKIDNQRAILRSGKSRFTLTTLVADEFPYFDGLSGIHHFPIMQKLLKKLIDKTHFCMAVQDVRYYLNGLLIELQANSIRAVATDGHRLAVCEQSIDLATIPEPYQLIIPRKGVLELLKLLHDSDDLVECSVGANHISLGFDHMVFTSKLLDGHYPDYNRVIPDDIEKEVVLDRALFKQALQRVAILSNEKHRAVRLVLQQKQLKIFAHNPEHDEAEEEIEVVSFNSSETLEIGFNANYIIDAISSMESDTLALRLNNINSSALLVGIDDKVCRYVVMPIRL